MARSRPSGVAGASLPLQWPLVGRHEELELFTDTLGDPRAHGFVIDGHAGVGKTRLADEFLGVAHQQGRTVARASAGEGTQSVPLGALAHLLPAGLADARCDLVAVLDGVAPVLRARAENGPFVLFVDDVHRLDTTSATLVAQLVDADLVFLVATLRTDEPTPPAIADLWQRGRVRRVELGELDKAGIDTLLHLVLRGPVGPATIESLWSASRGNVLFLRELVLGALESGRLVDQHGVWQITGPLVTTARLVELVEARIGEVGVEAREALDTIAMWEPTGLLMLEAAVEPRVLEDLDRSGLLLTRTDERRQQVALAHPLYGEIVRAQLPALTRRRLLLEYADRIEAYGARRREDPIRVATARIDSAATADADLLLEAARLARWAHDFQQVERLARAALVSRATPEAGLLLGEALHELGAYDEAQKVFADAQAAVAVDDPLFALIVSMRGLNLMWGLHRHDEALEVNRSAQAVVTDPAAAEELALWEATLLTYSGRPRDAMTVLNGLGEVTRPRGQAMYAIAEVPSLVALGRPVAGLARARGAFGEHIQLREQLAIADAGLHVINQIYALMECGEIRAAIDLAAAAYDASPPNAPPGGPMWLTHLLGRASLLAGRAATARRWLGEAVARSEENEFAGPQRLSLSLLATAHALLGDAEAAADAATDVDRVPELAYARAEQEFGRAWAMVAAGDVPGARAVLLAAADGARDSGYLTSEAWLRHDVARLGDAAAVADRLDELAATGEGKLVAAYAAHARAATGVRAEPLVEAADAFEGLGAMLFAAEAATEAAHALQRAGDARASSAMSARAMQLGRACEGARTPALATTAAFVPLSAREREIATFAANGETAKQIAARLFLSMRTVNNHLQNVYTKLGISGRAELADALGLSREVDRNPPGLEHELLNRVGRGG